MRNPTRAEIIDALEQLSYSSTANDNVLIFYAGHGWWEEEIKVGYWLPSDAQQHSKARWFRNSTLQDYIRLIKSRHTLLITDACFGGSIFKTRAAFSSAPPAISLLYELPSRKAMTSGALTEVPDESAFVRYLVNRLKSNKEEFLSSEKLFSMIRNNVMNNSYVVPQYGEIQNVGDEGGDFIFIKK